MFDHFKHSIRVLLAHFFRDQFLLVAIGLSEVSRGCLQLPSQEGNLRVTLVQIEFKHVDQVDVAFFLLSSYKVKLALQNLDLCLEFMDTGLVVAERADVVERWLADKAKSVEFDLKLLKLALH